LYCQVSRVVLPKLLSGPPPTWKRHSPVPEEQVPTPPAPPPRALGISAGVVLSQVPATGLKTRRSLVAAKLAS
jgi:hypothetical protein